MYGNDTKNPEYLEARRRFTSMIGMTGLFAGAAGLPFFSTFEMMANVLGSLFGDDDEPYDFKTDMRLGLAEVFGSEAATAIMKGPISAVSGVDISARVSMSNMWFRDPINDMDAEEKYMHYVGEALGPVVKIPGSMLRGASLMSEGYGRGIENMLPKAAKDVLKAHRYMNEGLLNYRGDEILDQDELGASDAMFQLLGFSPEKVSSQFEQSRAIKNGEQRIIQRRQNLLTRYALAARAGDDRGMGEAMEKIRSYNENVPRYPITSTVIKRSMKSRSRYSRDSMNGINLNKNLMYLADELDYLNK
jgi:hypothetical protein